MATASSRTAGARTASASSRSALVVAGMHRSGTSAVARLLSLAGGALPGNIIQPGPDNPTGFWEPADMVGLNDRILASVGSRWDDIFGHRVGPAVWERRAEHIDEARAFISDSYADASAAVLKDPRASLMIRFWDEALKAEGRRPVYVIMVRHPLEVAASIMARGDASEATAVMAWTAHMLSIERDTRGLSRVFVDYDDLLTDWRSVLTRVQATSGKALPPLVPEAEAEIARFLSPDQRHHQAREADLAARGDLWSGALTTLSWMRSAAKGTEPDATQLDDALVELERLARLVSPALRDLRAEAAAFPAMRQEIADLQKENAALRDLANQFHAEADHNGRHWEASRFMVGHLTGELAEARAEAERFRTEAEGVLGLRNEIGRAETRAIRQQVQNRELVQALETERHRGERLHKEAAETNARLDTLEREAAETARLRDDAVAVALANAARLEADRRSVLDAEIETLQRRVDELQQQASAQSALLTEQELGLAASREREAELRLRLEAIQTQKDRMVASASWKATRPLRVAAKRLKALTKGQP
jgi:hypothetical protein